MMIILAFFMTVHAVIATLCTIPPTYQKAMMESFDIPDDILGIIFDHSRPTDLFSLSLVNKRYQETAAKILLRKFARYEQGDPGALVPYLFKLLPLMDADQSLSYLLDPVQHIISKMTLLFSRSPENVVVDSVPALDCLNSKPISNMLGAFPFFSDKYGRRLGSSILKSAIQNEVDYEVILAILHRTVFRPKDHEQLMWRLLEWDSNKKLLGSFFEEFCKLREPSIFADVVYSGLRSDQLIEALEGLKYLDVQALIVLAKMGLTEELELVMNCEWLEIDMDETDWSTWKSILSLDDDLAHLILSRLGKSSRFSLYCDVASGNLSGAFFTTDPTLSTLFYSECVKQKTVLKLSCQKTCFAITLKIDYNVAYEYFKLMFNHYKKCEPLLGQASRMEDVVELKDLMIGHNVKHYDLLSSSKVKDYVKHVTNFLKDLSAHPDTGTECFDDLVLSLVTVFVEHEVTKNMALVNALVPFASIPEFMPEFEAILKESLTRGTNLDSLLDWVSSHQLSTLLEPNLRKMLNFCATKLIEADQVKDPHRYRAYQNYIHACVLAFSTPTFVDNIFQNLIGTKDGVTQYKEAMVKLSSASLRIAFFASVNFMIPPKHMHGLYDILMESPVMLNLVVEVLQKDPTAVEYLQPILNHPNYQSSLFPRAVLMARNKQFYSLLNLFNSETIRVGHDRILFEAVVHGIDEDTLGLILIHLVKAKLPLRFLSLVMQSEYISDAFIHWLILGFYCDADGRKIFKILAKCKIGRGPELKLAIAPIFPEINDCI